MSPVVSPSGPQLFLQQYPCNQEYDYGGGEDEQEGLSSGVFRGFGFRNPEFYWYSVGVFGVCLGYGDGAGCWAIPILWEDGGQAQVPLCCGEKNRVLSSGRYGNHLARLVLHLQDEMFGSGEVGGDVPPSFFQGLDVTLYYHLLAGAHPQFEC